MILTGITGKLNGITGLKRTVLTPTILSPKSRGKTGEKQIEYSGSEEEYLPVSRSHTMGA